MSKNKKMLRLFFAVDLEPSIKTQLLVMQDTLKESLFSANDLNAIQTVPPANFHITLSYLGNSTERQLEEIINNFEKLSINPFEVYLGDLFYWSKSSVLGVSLNDPDDKLLQVKKEIEKNISQTGFFSYDKKKFEPHITLFRKLDKIPENNLILGALPNYTISGQTISCQTSSSQPKVAINEISLMISTNNNKGVFYDPIETWPLKALSVKQQLLGL